MTQSVYALNEKMTAFRDKLRKEASDVTVSVIEGGIIPYLKLENGEESALVNSEMHLMPLYGIKGSVSSLKEKLAQDSETKAIASQLRRAGFGVSQFPPLRGNPRAIYAIT